MADMICAQPCEVCGDVNTMPCYTGTDTDVESWLCETHAVEQGFCRHCGQYSAGIESFDMNPGGICISCQIDMDIETADDDPFFDDDDFFDADDFDEENF